MLIPYAWTLAIAGRGFRHRIRLTARTLHHGAAWMAFFRRLRITVELVRTASLFAPPISDRRSGPLISLPRGPDCSMITRCLRWGDGYAATATIIMGATILSPISDHRAYSGRPWARTEAC